MTPRRALEILRGLIGAQRDFELFSNHFQTNHLLLRASPQTRSARAVLGADPAAALLAAERTLRAGMKFISACAPDDAAEKNELCKDMVEGFIAEGLKQDFTLLFHYGHLAFPRLALVKCALDLLFATREASNTLFWSPGPVQGAEVHFDAIDAVIIQLSGTKTWRVEMENQRRPNPWWKSINEGKTPGDYATHVLEKGDLLYIPAGQRHEAVAGQKGAIHVAIGFRPLTVRDSINALLDYVSDQRLDLRLPAFGLTDPRSGAWEADICKWEGAAKQLRAGLHQIRDAAENDETVRSAQSMQRADFIRGLPELPPAETIPEISTDTSLHLRDLAIGEIVLSESSATLHYPGGKMSGPRQIAPALHHILNHEHFTANGLPGPLTAKSKILLVRKLVQRGLIEMGDAQNGEY